MRFSEKLIILTLCGSIFMLTGCTTLSEKQKKMLSTVTVRSYEMAEGALHKPDGTASPNASSGVPAATGGGLIPALIGSAIDASVTSRQQKEFERNNSQYFTKVNGCLPSDLVRQLEIRAVKVLRSDPFFSSRLKNKSPNFFDGELVNYGLTRLYEKNGRIYLGATIDLNVWLMGGNGKKIFEQRLRSESRDAYTMRDYASNDSLSKRVFEQALDDFEVQFIKLLNAKLGR